MQNVKCKMKNAKCKMQNAKCKMKNDNDNDYYGYDKKVRKFPKLRS